VQKTNRFSELFVMPRFPLQNGLLSVWNTRFEKQSSIYAKRVTKVDLFKARLEEEHESWLRPG